MQNVQSPAGAVYLVRYCTETPICERACGERALPYVTLGAACRPAIIEETDYDDYSLCVATRRCDPIGE